MLRTGIIVASFAVAITLFMHFLPMRRTTLIIGGGLTGLVALRGCLVNGNAETLILLEARKELGGRIRRAFLNGQSVDIGATFIHGVHNNPVTQLVRRYNLSSVEVNYDRLVVYNSDGSGTVSLHTMEKMKREYDNLRQRVLNERDRLSRAGFRDVSIGLLFRKFTRLNLSSEEDQALSWHFFWEIVQDQIADLDDLSSYAFDASTSFEGSDHILTTGMWSIIDSLLRDIQNLSTRTIYSSNCDVSELNKISAGENVVFIVTDCPVQDIIDVAERSQWEVITSSGTKLIADKVIVTVPLSTLQRKIIRFVPPLPSQKWHSIRELGCGPTLKMALYFDSIPSLLKTEEHFIGIVDSASRGSKDLGFANHIEIINLQAVSGLDRFRGIYILEVEGNLAIKWSNISNKSALINDNVLPLLQTALHISGRELPKASAINNYVGDKYIGCGFSYWPPGRNGDDNLAIGDAIGTLQFAGEHTTPDYYGNLHGAIVEGERVSSSRSVWEDAFSRLWPSKATRRHFTPKWCPPQCNA